MKSIIQRIPLAAIWLFFGSQACAQTEEVEEVQEVKQINPQMETQIAVFASGCFWGTEYYMKRIDGVLETTVGYTGGHVKNPSYREVCTGRTGHYECTKVEYDPSKTDFETLARMFFETHDPTQANGQGPDIGPQYRSAIFYQSEDERAIAEKLIALLEEKGLNVATVVLPLETFYAAEDYHQDYYDNKGGRPYCHKYVQRF